jgi:hypothetical protein
MMAILFVIFPLLRDASPVDSIQQFDERGYSSPCKSWPRRFRGRRSDEDGVAVGFMSCFCVQCLECFLHSE